MKVVRLKIKMPFPIIDLGCVIYKHSKVKKISLPGYMLLVYISNGYRTGHHTMGECLSEAGIDSQMMDIFSKELFDLINTHHMVVCSEEIELRSELLQKMPTLPMKSLILTNEGHKLFRDQYIYDGEIDTKRQQLYYCPVERMFKTEAKLIKNSSFPVNAFDKQKSHPNKDNVEDFLNSIKETFLKLEKQELVIEVEDIVNKEIAYKAKEITIDITPDGADFVCEDGRYLEFLTENFKPEWLNNILIAQYGDCAISQVPVVPLNNIGTFNRLIKMNEIEEINHEGLRYLFGENKLAVKITHSKSLLFPERGIEVCRSIAPTCDIITVNDSGNMFSYEPIFLEIKPNGIKGITFHMPFIVERCLQEKTKRIILSKFKEAIHALMHQQDTIEEVVWLYNQIGDKSTIDSFVNAQLQRCKTLEEKSDVLLWVNSKMQGVKNWGDIFAPMADDFIDQAICNVTLENMMSKMDIVREVAKTHNVSPSTLIDRMIKNMPADVSVEALYNKLLEMEVPNDKILFYANIIPTYLNKIIENRTADITDSHKIASTFLRMGNHLADLRKYIGIEDDPTNFQPKEIGNVGVFKGLAGNFIREVKDIEKKYSSYAKKEFGQLLQFYNVVVEINGRIGEKSVIGFTKDDFIILADTNPSKCLSNLVTRMEIELRKLLNVPSDTMIKVKKLLDKAKERALISETDFGRLNVMREKRNDLLHNDKFNANSGELYTWIDSVFNIAKANNQEDLRGNLASKVETQADVQQLSLLLPHKYTYLTRMIQTDQKRAVECLVECEIAILSYLTSEEVTYQNMAETLSLLRTRSALPTDECNAFVELNRNYKDLKISRGTINIDKNNLERWRKVIFDFKPKKTMI